MESPIEIIEIPMWSVFLGALAVGVFLITIAPEFCERAIRWVTRGGCGLLARAGAGLSQAAVDIHGEHPTAGADPSPGAVVGTWWTRSRDAFRALEGKRIHEESPVNDRVAESPEEVQ